MVRLLKLYFMPVVNEAWYKFRPIYYADLGQPYYDVLMNEKTANQDYGLLGGQKLDLRNMFTE